MPVAAVQAQLTYTHVCARLHPCSLYISSALGREPMSKAARAIAARLNISVDPNAQRNQPLYHH